MKAREIIFKAYEQRPQFILTTQQIVDYIDELYLPHTKIFHNNDDYMKYRETLPRYSYTDERNGAGESGRKINGIIYVIPDPNEGELNKIEAFIKIEDKRKKLIDLRVLQRELYSKKTERSGLDSHNKIKNRIEILFEDVLEIRKDEKNAKNKTHDWHKIVPFLISGQINKLQQEGNGNLEAKAFSDVILKKYKIPLKNNQIRPYIQSTFFNTNSSTKNLYSENKVIAIIEFRDRKSVV